jgi:hypothetical protein
VGTRGNRLVPYRRFAIETDLPPEAVLRALAECIETRCLWNPFARTKKPYQGRVEGRSFSLRLTDWYGNFWVPVVRGSVEPRGTGALVRVRMRPFLIGFVIAGIWMGMCAVGVVAFAWSGPSLSVLAPLLMCALGYVVLMVGFGPEATKTTAFLCDVLKGRAVGDR